MSLAPPSLPSDMERLKWEEVPSNLEGRVVSLDELVALFPEVSQFSGIQVLEDAKNYRVYGRKRQDTSFFADQYLAYGCKKCNIIMVGSPEIKDEDSINIEDSQPLAGRRGYDLSCKQCYARLEDVTFELS